MPWITVDFGEQMYKRNHLRWVAARSKSHIAYQSYRVQRNKTRTYLRQVKNDYYDTAITESANKPKSLWAKKKVASQVYVYHYCKCNGGGCGGVWFVGNCQCVQCVSKVRGGQRKVKNWERISKINMCSHEFGLSSPQPQQTVSSKLWTWIMGTSFGPRDLKVI